LKNKPRLSLASIYLTFFVDNLCWSIVFPIFAPYFLNIDNPLFSPSVPISTRTTFLGLFLMAFSLGQFLGAPLIGDFADRTGRRKALLFTIPCTLLGLLLTAWSMQFYHLGLLFLGRLVTGIFASNGSICLASISDLSKDKTHKTKNFSHFSVLAGASFVVGAYLGGKLSDPTISASFFPELPIWVAAILSGFNFLFVFFGFSETIHVDPSKKYSLFSCFKNIKTALLTKRIHNIYAIYFLFIFSWTILLQFIPVVMIKRYGFTGSNIGDLALFVGAFWAIGSGLIKKWLLSFLSYAPVLKIAFLASLVGTACVTYPTHIYTLISFLGICVIAGGIIWPLCTWIISNLAGAQMQGKILSISQSIQAFAVTLASLIGGFSFTWSLHIPFLISSFAIFIAGIIFWTHNFKKESA
jgi:DHA1 family tetracycline resistance protein-like MFS transporter